MQERSDLSFFSTKKNPAPAGDEEGQMMPAANKLLMYFSMALVSGADKEKPGWRCAGQEVYCTVVGTVRGKEKAQALLNTSLRSMYS